MSYLIKLFDGKVDVAVGVFHGGVPTATTDI
jgi:hypothetical protein